VYLLIKTCQKFKNRARTHYNRRVLKISPDTTPYTLPFFFFLSFRFRGWTSPDIFGRGMENYRRLTTMKKSSTGDRKLLNQWGNSDIARENTNDETA